MDLDDADRQQLAAIERELHDSDPRLARRLSRLGVNRPTTGPSAASLCASLILMVLDRELFIAALSGDHLVLLFVAILAFPAVLAPIARSVRRAPS